MAPPPSRRSPASPAPMPRGEPPPPGDGNPPRLALETARTLLRYSSNGLRFDMLCGVVVVQGGGLTAAHELGLRGGETASGARSAWPTGLCTRFQADVAS